MPSCKCLRKTTNRLLRSTIRPREKTSGQRDLFPSGDESGHPRTTTTLSELVLKLVHNIRGYVVVDWARLSHSFLPLCSQGRGQWSLQRHDRVCCWPWMDERWLEKRKLWSKMVTGWEPLTDQWPPAQSSCSMDVRRRWPVSVGHHWPC